MTAKKKKKKKTSLPAKILNFTGQLILFVVIIMCLPLTVPRLFGFEVYNVVSGSMEPEIPVGSIVIVNEMDSEEIVEGDIIAFYSPSNPEATITHRVLEKDDAMQEFTTKGDANAEKDLAPIPYACLIGRVDFYMPYVGNIYAQFVSDSGKLVVIGIVIFAVVLQIISLYLPTGKKKSVPSEKEKKEDTKEEI